MISLKLNGVPTLFIQGFTRDDTESIVSFVREANERSSIYRDTVLFVDTPATPRFVDAVRFLKSEGYRVVYRDHHGISGTADNVRDEQKLVSTRKIEQLLGSDCFITYRDYHPACSTLVEVGEFKEALAIIADPDADGLTAAMKAAGIFYPELDDDAAKLDGEPALQITGSEISKLLAKGLSTLPSYDPARPKEREQSQQRLFTLWVQAVQGDTRALAKLDEATAVYDAAVEVAERLSSTVELVAPAVGLVDVTDCPIYDVGTLTTLIETGTDCQITVLRKDKGPIAALHGIQYSLAVTKRYKDSVDLRPLLPPGLQSSPETGVISNLSFLLHVNETVWNEHVLPSLQERSVSSRACAV